eukprot:11569628-Ditylum_brightwellii.AAC.1
MTSYPGPAVVTAVVITKNQQVIKLVDGICLLLFARLEASFLGHCIDTLANDGVQILLAVQLLISARLVTCPGATVTFVVLCGIHHDAALVGCVPPTSVD